MQNLNSVVVTFLHARSCHLINSAKSMNASADLPHTFWLLFSTWTWVNQFHLVFFTTCSGRESFGIGGMGFHKPYALTDTQPTNSVKAMKQLKTKWNCLEEYRCL